MRILMVENEPGAAFLTVNIIKSLGFEVVGTAATIEEIILTKESLSPDLILLESWGDQQSLGIELIQPHGLTMPVIYLSDQALVINEAFPINPAWYLRKPVSKEILRLTLEMAFLTHQHEQQLKENQELYHLLTNNTKALQLAEEKVKRISLENSKLSIFTSTTNNAVIITDPQGRIDWINKGFTQFSEYTLEDVKGKKPGAVLQGKETDPATVTFMREALKMQRAFKVEIINYSKSGQLYWLDIEVQPFFDEHGKLINFLALQLNITERKLYESALKKAKEEAEMANQAKSAFLATMSHEIRTPMNAIIGLTDMLLDEPLVPRVIDNIRTIKYSANNLLKIINGILDFSKIESGMFTFEALEFDLSTLIENLNNLFASKVTEKAIQMHFSLPTEVPAILIGDPYRLNQILLNLLSNALKFTQEGSIELSISPLSNDKADIVLLFEVKDTGIGIDANKLDSIFSSFSQAYAHTTRQFGGTGLGLSITKNLVEMQGGSIKVASQLGKGSLFSFQLPFKISEKKTLTSPIIAVEEANDLTGISVLLVEDNAVNRMLNEQLFKKWNANFQCASDGLQALDWLGKQAFNIVIMDLQMPNLNGYETAQLIRNAPKTAIDNRQIPIIALTANAFEHSRQEAMAAGMNDFISKPFQKDHLLQTIFTQLGIKKNSETHQSSTDSEEVMLPVSQGINLSIIKEIVGEDHQALLSVLQEFTDTTQLDMDIIVQAYANNDLQTVADVAHKLRSAFRYFGADQVEKLLEELELIARKIVAEQNAAWHATEQSTLQPLIANILSSNKLILNEVERILENKNN
ncbi:MAG: response regulator [Bacteroidota bacterium]